MFDIRPAHGIFIEWAASKLAHSESRRSTVLMIIVLWIGSSASSDSGVLRAYIESVVMRL
jgi:hypothetical protein